MTNHTEDTERLSRLEAVVEALGSDVRSLASTVRGLAEGQGKPNWSAWAVAIAAVVPAIGAFAWAINNQGESLKLAIDGVEARSAMRYADTHGAIMRVQDQAAADTRDERTRNNLIERDLGRIEGRMEERGKVIDALQRAAERK